MSGERSPKSHAVSWVPIVIIAVATIYILSVPPLTRVVTHPGIRKSDGKWVTIGRPDWLRAYAQPYQWLRENTPLAGVLQRYGEWFGYVVK